MIGFLAALVKKNHVSTAGFHFEMLKTNETNLHIPIAYKLQSSREVIIEKNQWAFAREQLLPCPYILILNSGRSKK